MKNIAKNISALTISMLYSFSLAANEVELLSAFNILMSKYGHTVYTEQFTVAVDNISPEKSVYIQRELSDGKWIDIPLHYLTTSGNGKELWSGGHNIKSVGDEFVVKMEAYDTSYYDNNNSSNYLIQDSGFLLGNGKMVAVHNSNTSNLDATGTQQQFFTTIVVKNLAPKKQITLHYSLDDWQTVNSIEASYAGNPVWYGYGTYSNPNIHNAESWFAKMSLPADATGEFYIEYQVADKTYYDNNYGANYPLSTMY